MPSISALIAEIKSGNRLAYTLCYQQYHKGVYAFALKYTHSTAMAEDVVQHTFLRLWEMRRTLREDGSLTGFLFTIARNHTLNLIRGNHIKVVITESETTQYVDERTSVMPQSDTAQEDSEVVDELLVAIRNLSPQQRLIFDLKLSEGLSNQEIADRLNISVNSVKTQYSRSLKHLRSKVKDYYIN